MAAVLNLSLALNIFMAVSLWKGKNLFEGGGLGGQDFWAISKKRLKGFWKPSCPNWRYKLTRKVVAASSTKYHVHAVKRAMSDKLTLTTWCGSEIIINLPNHLEKHIRLCSVSLAFENKESVTIPFLKTLETLWQREIRLTINGRRIYGGCTPPFTIFLFLAL